MYPYNLITKYTKLFRLHIHLFILTYSNPHQTFIIPFLNRGTYTQAYLFGIFDQRITKSASIVLNSQDQ